MKNRKMYLLVFLSIILVFLSIYNNYSYTLPSENNENTENNNDNVKKNEGKYKNTTENIEKKLNSYLTDIRKYNQLAKEFIKCKNQKEKNKIKEEMETIKTTINDQMDEELLKAYEKKLHQLVEELEAENKKTYKNKGEKIQGDNRKQAIKRRIEDITWKNRDI